MSQPVRSEVARPLVIAALAYASKLGWAVFPLQEIIDGVCSCKDRTECENVGKHPRVKRGLLAASTDVKVISAWWKHWPRANIGIACGASDIVVVDIDPRNGGDDSLVALEREHGSFPTAPTQLTGGGGQHYVFRRPKTQKHLKSKAIALGVDVKADGGYIVASPSTHVSGTCYSWDAGAHPSETEIPPLPKWIEDLIVEQEPAEYAASTMAPIEGFLGAAFSAAGWAGRALGPTKMAVRCPWEDEHSSGSRFNSSTVVFSPTPGRITGWFHCSHSHCANRSLQDVLRALPAKAKAEARKRLGLPQQFEPLPESEPSPVEDPDRCPWMESLRTNQKGILTRDPGNAALLVANLPEWAGAIEYDEFADRIRLARPVPVLPGLRRPQPGEELGDEHCTYIGHWMARHRGVAFSREALRDAINLAAQTNQSNPLREYLEHLEWDGTQRIHSWLRDYLGAPGGEYEAVTGRWWLISAVARALRPGCQCDHVLVLEGAQGVGKSQALRVLGGEWYLGDLPDLRDKDASHVLQGRWIVEVGELDAFRGAATSRIKNYMTQETDIYRPSYGRYFVRRPRSCVFAGTTNESHWIHDSTGGRRFWPVRCSKVDTEKLVDDRDQLFAEAVKCFHAGEDWYPSAEYVGLIAEEQELRTAPDAWEGVIERWAEATNRPFTTHECLAGAIGMQLDRIDRSSQTRVGIILGRLGYESVRPRAGESRERKYSRP